MRNLEVGTSILTKLRFQSRYNSKLREHTATLGQMTKELDSTRAAEKALRTKLRDMELDNDDLEKSERFVLLPSRTRAVY